MDKPLVPPQSIQAEQSVLGGLLLDNSAFHAVRSVLSVEDFYHKNHRVVFNALLDMGGDDLPMDVVTVSEVLKTKGFNESPLSFLASITHNTPSAANILSYAQIVRDKSILRTIISVSREMSALAFSAEGVKTSQIIADAEAKIFALSQSQLKGQNGFKRLKLILAKVVDKMEDDYENPPADGVAGLSTGFEAVDKLTNGLSAGNLIIIAARPSMGKTAIAMNIAQSVAADKKKPVAVFSMEMGCRELAQRLMASVGSVPLQHIMQSWKADDDDWPKITSSINRLSDAPLFIDDSPALSINDIRSRLMRLTSEIATEFSDGLEMVIIDYIQLMTCDNRNIENRNNQIEEITRGLKQLAKTLNCPVVALSQLNRNLENRPNKRPILSDLRESGAIEQDADIIIFPYRDEIYNADSPDKGKAEIIVGKNRNGALGTARLLFEGQFTRFRSFDTDYQGNQY